MNGLLIILSVLITVIITFWFIDKFQISDRFINLLGAVFGMFSLISLTKDKDRVLKIAFNVLVFASILMIAALGFDTLVIKRAGQIQMPFRVDAPLTQNFHANHKGLDFGLDTGTPLYPIMDGTVIRTIPCPKCDNIRETISTGCAGTGVYNDIDWGFGYGRAVVISHDQRVGYLYSLYSHLDRINVQEGDKVTTNTILGYSGNSGCSTGSHLHFELRRGNVEDVRGVWTKQHALNPAEELGWEVGFD